LLGGHAAAEREEGAMSAGAQGVHAGPGEGATIGNPVGGSLTFKVRGEQSAGQLLVIESEIPPGDGPPLHVHANEDEGLYTLAGEVQFRLGDDVRPAPPGAFMFVPRGVPHCFQNVGDGVARILVFFTPAGMERFFERFAALAAADMTAEAFRTLGAEVGMEVAGPPLARSHPR
jgi:quercetin dioxygenase-like cupin family protein